jgi:cobalt/nickel transport system permease protein
VIATAGAAVGRGPLVSLDARVKLATTFAIVGSCLAARQPAVLVAYGVVVLVLLLAAAIPPRWLGARLAAGLILALLVTAGALWPGSGGPSWHHVGGILVRALLCIAAVSWLVGTTGLARLLESLERLRVPPLLLDVVATTHRYGLLLADESRRMRRAALVRGARWRWLGHIGTAGRLVATLFLRAYERGERVHAAMLARGLENRRPELPPRPLSASDLRLGALLVALSLVPWLVPWLVPELTERPWP